MCLTCARRRLVFVTPGNDPLYFWVFGVSMLQFSAAEQGDITYSSYRVTDSISMLSPFFCNSRGFTGSSVSKTNASVLFVQVEDLIPICARWSVCMYVGRKSFPNTLMDSNGLPHPFDSPRRPDSSKVCSCLTTPCQRDH